MILLLIRIRSWGGIFCLGSILSLRGILRCCGVLFTPVIVANGNRVLSKVQSMSPYPYECTPDISKLLPRPIPVMIHDQHQLPAGSMSPPRSDYHPDPHLIERSTAPEPGQAYVLLHLA